MNENLYKLISDYNSDFEYTVLCEQKNAESKKEYKIRGPYIVCEQKNANKRVYNGDVMKRAVTEYDENFIKTKRALGELSHPQSAVVSLENACHLVESLSQDGNTYNGVSKILVGHPKGDLCLALLLNGVKIGVSTRGVGKMNKDSVVDDYKLIAVDVVADPSAPGAYVGFTEGVLESKSFMLNEHRQIVEVAYANLENTLKVLPKHSDEKKILIQEALKRFIKEL